MTYLAAYDVREDDRRAHLAAMLQTVGDRVQKSVFVIIVDAERLNELQQQALKVIDSDTDSLLFFRQYSACWTTQIKMGQGHVPEPITHWAVF